MSPMEESHLVPHLSERTLRKRAGAIRAVAQRIEHARGLAFQLRRALPHRAERLDHVVGQDALAVETTPPRGPALLRDLHDGVGGRESLMERENVANLRRAGILAGLASRIGGRGSELLPDRFGGLEQSDRVPQGLGHLGLAVEPEYPFRIGQQRLGLGEEIVRVAGVPAPRNLAHQLEMLDLVLTDRHETSFIEQYVSRL